MLLRLAGNESQGLDEEVSRVVVDGTGQATTSKVGEF